MLTRNNSEYFNFTTFNIKDEIKFTKEIMNRNMNIYYLRDIEIYKLRIF